MTIDEFLKIQAGVESVRAKPGYTPNPIIEDFWALIEAYKVLLIQLDRAEGRRNGFDAP